MTTRALRISERSSGWVGVIRIAVAMFDCDVQIPQFVVRTEKTAEDDNSLNGEEPVAIGIVLLTLASNPISAFSAVWRLTLPAAEARTKSSPLSVKVYTPFSGGLT